jgi:hypothetical protein
MPLRIGLIAYPLFMAWVLSSQKGAAARFIKAGATSLETARRPSSLRANADQVADAVKSGVLVPTGDGRYFVDLTAYRRRRWLLIAALSIGFALVTALTIWFSWPSGAG